MRLRIACASDGNGKFYPGHFGDAEVFLVYAISSEGHTLERTVENTVPEEKTHGDPEKARGIASLMKGLGVSVLVNRQFGPNIVSIKKAFLPVVPDTDDIERAVRMLSERYGDIEALARGPPPYNVYFLR